MDMEKDEIFCSLCAPLPKSLMKNPNPKKVCAGKNQNKSVSFAFILKAIRELREHF